MTKNGYYWARLKLLQLPLNKSRVWWCADHVIEISTEYFDKGTFISKSMVHFRVFLGAPTSADTDSDLTGYVWQTLQEPSQSEPYPPATLNAASRRISLLYQNVIFDSSLDSEPDHGDDHVDDPGMSLLPGT